jgi:hypothetical protein
MNSDPIERIEDADLRALVAMIRAEADLLAERLDDARDLQWLPSVVPRPRDDTSERGKGGHSDPTPIVALDERRLAIRVQVRRSEALLRGTATNLRGVRRGLEIALDAWAGFERN